MFLDNGAGLGEAGFQKANPTSHLHGAGLLHGPGLGCGVRGHLLGLARALVLFHRLQRNPGKNCALGLWDAWNGDAIFGAKIPRPSSFVLSWLVGEAAAARPLFRFEVRVDTIRNLLLRFYCGWAEAN